MWWRKHPKLWPFRVPEDLSYWLKCVQEGRRYYAVEPRMLAEVEWYKKTLRRDKEAMRRAIAEFRRWAIEDDAAGSSVLPRDHRRNRKP
jgi:hypothetical protein